MCPKFISEILYLWRILSCNSKQKKL